MIKGIDLNRSFFEKPLHEEAKIFYKEVKKDKLNFFHALHEDLDEKRFYLYNLEDKSESIYKKIISLAKKSFPINKKSIIENCEASGGMITNKSDKSFEYRLFKEKAAPYSLCTETPMKQPLKRRVELNVKIMKLILKFIEEEIK